MLANSLIGLIVILDLSIEKDSLSNSSLYAFLLSIFLTFAYRPILKPPSPHLLQQYLLFCGFKLNVATLESLLYPTKRTYCLYFWTASISYF